MTIEYQLMVSQLHAPGLKALCLSMQKKAPCPLCRGYESVARFSLLDCDTVHGRAKDFSDVEVGRSCCVVSTCGVDFGLWVIFVTVLAHNPCRSG